MSPAAMDRLIGFLSVTLLIVIFSALALGAL